MNLFSLASVVVLAAHTQPNRIDQIRSQGNAVERIYLSAGLATVVEFPKPVIEVRVGNPRSIKVQISQVSPKELTLNLKPGVPQSSNLIVRSGKRMYVLDIVASKVTHQDYVKVRGSSTPQTQQNPTVISSKRIAP